MMEKSFLFFSTPATFGSISLLLLLFPWEYCLGDFEITFFFSVAVVLRSLIPKLLAIGRWRASTLKSGGFDWLQFVLSSTLYPVLLRYPPPGTLREHSSTVDQTCSLPLLLSCLPFLYDEIRSRSGTEQQVSASI